MLETELSIIRSLKDPLSQIQPFLVHKTRMRNSVFVQTLFAAQMVQVLEEDNWDQGGADFHVGEPEEHCQVQVLDNWDQGGAELHAVEVEEHCHAQVLDHCHDGLPLDVGGHAGYQNG